MRCTRRAAAPLTYAACSVLLGYTTRGVESTHEEEDQVIERSKDQVTTAKNGASDQEIK
jgi:hypothetical protein